MMRALIILVVATISPAYGQTVLNPFRAEVGTTAGTLAAGDDPRIVNSLQKSANLSDIDSAASARSSLGLGSLALQNATSAEISGGTLGGITLGNEGDATFNAGGVRLDDGSLSISNQHQYGFQNNAVAASITSGPGNGIAQVIGGSPGLVAEPSGIALYQDRDFVTLYVGALNPAPYLPGVSAVHYTPTSVTLASPIDTSRLRVNMFIDTADSPKFTGIITGWASDGTQIEVSGWFQAGNTAPGQVPTSGALTINPNTKIWAINANADMYAGGEAKKATAFELGINNRTGADDSQNQLWGMDVVNLGENAVGTGVFARGYMQNAFRAGTGQGGTGTNAGYLYDPGETGFGSALLSYAPGGCLFSAWTSVRGQTLCGDTASGSLDLGALGVAGAATSPVIRFHTTGGQNSFDAQIAPSGGTAGTAGAARLTYAAGSDVMAFNQTQSITMSPQGPGAVGISAAEGQSLILGGGGDGVVGTSSGLLIGAPQLELGASQAAVGTAPYIDLHYGTGSIQDYNVRITNDQDGSLSLYNASGLMGRFGSSGLSVPDITLSASKPASQVFVGPTQGSGSPAWRQLTVADVAGAASVAMPTFSGTANFNMAPMQGAQVTTFGPNGVGLQATGPTQTLYLAASGQAPIVAQNEMIVAPGRLDLGSTTATGYVDFHISGESSSTDYSVRITNDSPGQLNIYGPGSTLWGRFSPAGLSTPSMVGDVTGAHVNLPSGASALGTLLQKLNASVYPGELIQASNYGVVCDGQTDVTAGINAALAATSANFGGTVVLPGGACIVTGTLEINNNNVELRGQGMWVTYVVTNGANFNVVSLNGGYNQSVKDLAIFNYGFPAGNTPYYAIADGPQAYGAGGAVIENVAINGTQSGIESRGGKTRHHNIDIENLRPGIGIGILFDPSAQSEVHDLDQIFMQNPFPSTVGGVTSFADMVACIKITGGFDYEMTHLQLQKCGNPLVVTGGGSIRSIGGYFDTSAGDAVLLDGTHSAIVRVTLLGGWASSSATGNGIHVVGNVIELEVADFECYENAQHCIDTSSASNVDGLLIHDLKAAGNGGCAVNMGAGLSGFTLSNVVAAPQGEWGGNGCGVAVLPGASNNYMIVGSRLQGSKGSNLSDGGTGAAKLVANNLVGP